MTDNEIITQRLLTSNNLLLERWHQGYYDFLDLGTCDGGGFIAGHQLGGHAGLGFDIDPNVVIRNLDVGRDVVCPDIAHLRSLGLHVCTRSAAAASRVRGCFVARRPSSATLSSHHPDGSARPNFRSNGRLPAI